MSAKLDHVLGNRTVLQVITDHYFTTLYRKLCMEMEKIGCESHVVHHDGKLDD
jgi:hypothetical protein